MTIRGLEANSNPLGQTNLIKKLHTDPLSWGFLIQDDQMILDYPERLEDMRGDFNVTERDLDRLNREVYKDEKVRILAYKEPREAVYNIQEVDEDDPTNIFDEAPLRPTAGGWSVYPTNRTNHLQFVRKLYDGNMSRDRAKITLQTVTGPVETYKHLWYTPYNDVKVEITNPYTYTPYLLRKHKTKKRKKH